MTVVADKSVTPTAEALLACLELEIGKVEKPPAVTSMRVGDQVELLFATRYDECCRGVAWVRVVAIFPSTNFPLPDVAYQPCGPGQWAAVLEMGAARCAPTPGKDSIPSGDEWNAVAAAVQDDAAAMRRALCCWTGLDLNEDRMYMPGTWAPLTTEGGCVGGVMPVTVMIGACDC